MERPHGQLLKPLVYISGVCLTHCPHKHPVTLSVGDTDPPISSQAFQAHHLSKSKVDHYFFVKALDFQVVY
jgi:hypothetical protein